MEEDWQKDTRNILVLQGYKFDTSLLINGGNRNDILSQLGATLERELFNGEIDNFAIIPDSMISQDEPYIVRRYSLYIKRK